MVSPRETVSTQPALVRVCFRHGKVRLLKITGLVGFGPREIRSWVCSACDWERIERLHKKRYGHLEDK